jgi:hypothetical protein
MKNSIIILILILGSNLYGQTDFNKEKLFTRTLEWLSINYGLIPSYIYSNLQEGKIIFKNNLNIITLVFSISLLLLNLFSLM